MSPEEMFACVETLKHSEGVRNIIDLVIMELMSRARDHDQEKLKEPELAYFAEWTPKLAAATYGSLEYQNFLKSLKPALDHHYAKYRHHPEFFGISEKWLPLDLDPYYEISDLGRVREDKGSESERDAPGYGAAQEKECAIRAEAPSL
jgi:hypothetical protein